MFNGKKQAQMMSLFAKKDQMMSQGRRGDSRRGLSIWKFE
jgi:hypothetical protein